MSRIDDLIAELAPEGIPCKALGDVGRFLRGNGLQKKDLTNEGVPAIHYGQVHTTYGTWAAETVSFVAPEFAKTLRRAAPGDLVLATTSEDDDAVAKAVAWLGAEEVAISGDAYIYRHTLDPKYVAYYFQSSWFHDQKKRSITGTKVRRIARDALAKIMIPVPPREVQIEIVEVLEKLSSSRAGVEHELGAELDLRRRQYKHYRDALLSFDGTDCDWLTLSEAAIDFGRGKSKHRPRNDPKLYGGRYPFIQTGDIRNSGHLITKYSQTYNEEGLAQSKLWPRGTICITIAANIAETGILDFAACFPDSVVGMVANPDRASRHYVEYLLQSFRASLAAKGRGSAQANINLALFESERFPFPPLKEQERVVAILDRLDGLVSELSIALRAERDARCKQYEHYRDRLLTFKELTA